MAIPEAAGSALSGDVEKDMDTLIEVIQAVMDEDDECGAEFGKLYCHPVMEEAFGSKVIGLIMDAKRRKIVQTKPEKVDMLLRGQHDEVIILLRDPKDRLRPKSKAKAKRKALEKKKKAEAEQAADEHDEELRRQEEEKEKLRKQGFYDKVDTGGGDADSDPPPPDSSSSSSSSSKSSGSDPPPPDSDSDSGSSKSKKSGSSSDDDPPPPSSSSSSSSSSGKKEEEKPAKKAPPKEEEEPAWVRLARERAQARGEGTAKAKKVEEMSEWEKKEAKRAAVPKPEEKKYSYEELRVSKSKLTREDINLVKREEYLSAEEFQKVFEMDIEEFRKLPMWKRAKMKSEADLF